MRQPKESKVKRHASARPPLRHGMQLRVQLAAVTGRETSKPSVAQVLIYLAERR